MNVSWKSQVIMSVAAFLGIGIIAFTLVLFPWERPLEPLDVLPADSTLVYFDGADSAAATRLASFLPMDIALPVDDTKATFAIVKLPSSLAWIRFDASSEKSKASMNASDPHALSLLVTDRNLSLRLDQTFRHLTAPIHEKTSLLYVRHERLASLPLFTQLRIPEADVAIGLNGQQVQIAFPWNTSSPTLPIDATEPPSDIIAFTQTSNAQELIDSISSLLQPTARLSMQALLAQWVKEYFGNEVSLASAFSPMLHSHATFAIQQTASGATSVVLDAMAPHSQEILDNLHAGFRSHLTASSRQQRTFDERFTVDILSNDPSMIEDRITADAGWAQKATLHTTLGKGFLSAVRGNRVILSTSESLLQGILRARRATGNDPSLVAWGLVDLEAMNTLLVAHHWPLPLPNIAPFQGKSMLWTLARRGDVGIVSIQ